MLQHCQYLDLLQHCTGTLWVHMTTVIMIWSVNCDRCIQQRVWAIIYFRSDLLHIQSEISHIYFVFWRSTANLDTCLCPVWSDVSVSWFLTCPTFLVSLLHFHLSAVDIMWNTCWHQRAQRAAGRSCRQENQVRIYGNYSWPTTSSWSGACPRHTHTAGIQLYEET